MFGEVSWIASAAEQLLELYSLEDLLEINNVEETEVVEYLLRVGRLEYPTIVLERFKQEG